jgi:hypothetical protein
LKVLFLSIILLTTTIIGSINVYGANDNETQHDGTGVTEPKEPKIVCDKDNCNCDDDEKLVNGHCEPKDPEPSTGCDDSYPDDCIPSPPPDLDCKDVGNNIKVKGSDPHDLDRDGNGIGCESGGDGGGGNGGSNGGSSNNGGSDNNNDNNDVGSSNSNNNYIPQNNVNVTNNSTNTTTLADGKNVTTFYNGTIKISDTDGVITRFVLENITISTYVSYPNGSIFAMRMICIPSPHNIAPLANRTC